MSRLIVKNLPHGIKEEKLRQLFETKGQITDCSLKYAKDGAFRRFAFIGFKTPEEAKSAIGHFNKTFISSTRIQVELAKDFGDKTKPRAWSKYSSESSANQKKAKKDESKEKVVKEKAEGEKKKKAKERLNAFLGELHDDPDFKEFLNAHQNVGVKASWGNDTTEATPVTSLKEITKNSQNNVSEDDDDVSDSDDSEGDQKDLSESGDDSIAEDANKTASKKQLSDLEYLKTKMSSKDLLSDSSSLSSSSDEEDEEDEEENVKRKSVGKKIKDESAMDLSEGSDSEVGDSNNTYSQGKAEVCDSDSMDSRGKGEKTKDKTNVGESTRAEIQTQLGEKEKKQAKYVLKIRGMQGNFGEKILKDFFKPLQPVSIRIPRNAKRTTIGIAFVEFSTEKELDQALRKNKNFINGKRVFLKRSQVESDGDLTEEKPRPWELKIQQDRAEEDEGIAESGRLFVRNLSYTCKEEDVEELFKKFGLLTEVNLPVDRLTKKVKGFAHVTFMIPENAVRAFVELDGTVFQGRMLHILPGKMKKEELDLTEKSSYKKQKESQQKALAKSSHNWNTLFLGANAVADAIAQKYATSKSQLLNVEGSESLGVRMALGETQIIAETRDFLQENGVCLDSFSQAAAARSKTVILAKNLPAGTRAEELRDIFGKYGTLGRLVLPPTGISALIEYLEPTEARAGFTKLAYTKFHHMPLYLEWAPMGVFKTELVRNKEEAMEGETEEREEDKEGVPEEQIQNEETDSDSDEEVEPESIVFVKNLNFDTTEENLKKTFERCGKVRVATIAKKKDFKNPGQFLSMGYGFVEYRKQASAQRALKDLQHVSLDDHQLELKISNRVTVQTKVVNRKKQSKTKQKSSKILVRNIPFEANKKEVFELFRVFGELKTVRLPKKLSGTGTHRGFGFVDFLTKQDAKRAFNALCHSTHLYGRRLVLEWAEQEENIDQLRKKTAENFHDESPKKKFKKSSIMENLEAVGAE